MTLEIKDWPLGRIGELADIYNAQVAGLVPHCYPITPDWFSAGWHDPTNTDALPSFPDGCVLVGLREGKKRGFAHVRVGGIMQSGSLLDGGFIHFLTYEVGHRDVGEALLKQCEQYSEDLGADTMHAFDGRFYRFHHLGYPLASDKMGHVCGLLGMNGYKIADEGEMFMEYLDYDVVVPVLPRPACDIQVSVKEGHGELPNITVEAVHLGQDLGNCVLVSCGDYNGAHEAQNRIFVKGLWVMKEVRGRGWGRYLLMRALDEAYRRGYRHTIISTAQTNYRAQLFYTNYGYRVTDMVYGFVKQKAPLADAPGRRPA